MTFLPQSKFAWVFLLLLISAVTYFCVPVFMWGYAVRGNKVIANRFLETHGNKLKSGEFGNGVNFEIWPSNGLLLIRSENKEHASKINQYIIDNLNKIDLFYTIEYMDQSHGIVRIPSPLKK